MRRRRRIWAVVAVIVVVVAAGVPTTMWLMHWRASLHSLIAYPGYGVSIPVPVNHAEYFGETAVRADESGQPDTGQTLTLTVTSIRPIVMQNTANATVRVLRCVLAATGHGPVAEPPANCATLRPFTSGRVKLGFGKGDDDIVITVTPRRAGTVRIAGAELHYSSGIRHGVQHIGGRLATTPQ